MSHSSVYMSVCPGLSTTAALTSNVDMLGYLDSKQDSGVENPRQAGEKGPAAR